MTRISLRTKNGDVSWTFKAHFEEDKNKFGSRPTVTFEQSISD
jgi:hypothetical protein